MYKHTITQCNSMSAFLMHHLVNGKKILGLNSIWLYCIFLLCTQKRRYLPKLKDYPNRYIHEPWNAPESVQRACNCVVGVDYPKPMVRHAETSRLNIERMKQVYQQFSQYKGLSEYTDTLLQSQLSNLCFHTERLWNPPYLILPYARVTPL